jgi:hypothetical protein
MSATWTISQLERNTADGGVVVAHWRATMQDGDYSASSYGTCSFEYDASAPGFTPYDQLTENQVIVWVWGQVDKMATEAALTASIDEKKNPTTEAGLPW